MTTVKNFTNNTLDVYAYEKFDYTISNPNLSYTLQTVSNTSGLEPQSLYFTKDGSNSYRFSVTDASNNLTAGTTQTFVLTITDPVTPTISQTSSNTVVVNPGRFLYGSAFPPNGNYTFFKNETITPIRLIAPSFTLAPPTSVPTLPPGLSFSFVASNIYDIVGYPLTTVPTSNYQIIGRQSNASKIVTTKFNITVSNEQLRVDPSGIIISNMIVGTAITPRTITAAPPVTGGGVQYTFPLFPDGIVAKDNFGNIVTSGFLATDPLRTLVIEGTPTPIAAEAFRDASATSEGLTRTVVATRTNPLPVLSNTVPVTFAFGPTVLFDTPILNPIYAGVPVIPGSNRFRAKTYFGTTPVAMTTIFSPDLRSDLSLIFFPEGPSGGYADLSTVSYTTAGGPSNFTIRAINASNISNDYPVTIEVINDVVSFTKLPTDVCFNFVLSRPVNQTLPGYYSSNIQYQAQAGSKFPVVLSAPALVGTGLSLDSNGIIVGIPTSTKPLTSLVVKATASVTDVSISDTRLFAILDESFTFLDVSSSNFDFVQNVPITPFQIPVTTLSGRSVIDYTLTGNPPGITISPVGVISGTCLGATSGTMTVTTTTGFASGSNVYPYSVIPDTILFTVPKDVWLYKAGDPVDIPVTGVSFSGTAVSNYAITLPSSFGLTIGSNSGLISGSWTDGIPPNQLIPASSTFNVSAIARSISGILPATFTADQLIKSASFVWAGNTFFTQIDSVWSNLDSNMANRAGAFDIQFRNSNIDGNVVLATARDRIYQSTNYASFTSVSFESIFQLCSTLTFDSTLSIWWVSGTNTYEGVRFADIVQSDDNGQSWSALSTLTNSVGQSIRARDNNIDTETNPYLCAGIALRFNDGVLMAGGIPESGGPTTIRSTNYGFSWSSVSGSFTQEVAYFNFDHPSTWIATGSSGYQTRTTPVYSTSTDTIKYSTDKGLNWSNATGGFTMMGYELVYASNTWLATGVSYDGSAYKIELKYSSNGSNWSNIDLSTNYLFPERNASFTKAPLPLGSMEYDGSNWNIFVQRYDTTLTQYVSEIYSHNNVFSIPSDWSVRTVTSQFNIVSNDANRRFVSLTRPQYLRSSSDKNIGITLTFTTKIGLGPTLTSPAQRSFLQYQYIPITPIQLEADDAYFFIAASELPPGLSFNPLTRQITGKPVEPGSFSTRVYAKNDDGVTATTLSFTVNIPRIIRKQDGAGAYTSLLKQYTEVVAAQTARDNRVLPTQSTRLGEFMSPVPANVTTAIFNTNCANCGRVECPAANAIVSSEGARTAICDFIDANGTELFDAGNANTNLLCDN